MFVKFTVFFQVFVRLVSACDHDVHSDSLNVHVVCYSHWKLFTAENRNIFTSVVDVLSSNSDRRFIMADVAFLDTWWQNQTVAAKQTLRRLADNGQFEIVGGGWVVNEEVTPSYKALINQLTLGLRFIEDSIGPCGRPKVGWQIDVLGHSSAMAEIFARSGYLGLFLGKLDYRDKAERQKTKTLEFLWQGKNWTLFTSVLYDLYTHPSGMCFNVFCLDHIDENNQAYKSQLFRKYILEHAENYKTNNILVPMRHDFSYLNSEYSFDNLDFLIKSMSGVRTNDGRLINVFYSTPSCYIKAVNEMAKLKGVAFTNKTNDFFPFADKESSYWSGYFTSHTNTKGLVRDAEHTVQITNQLLASLTSNRLLPSDVLRLQKSLASIYSVYNENSYNEHSNEIRQAIKGCDNKNAELVSKLINKYQNNYVNLIPCSLIEKNCENTDAKTLLVAVYNPLTNWRNTYVTLKSRYKDAVVKTMNGTKVPFQLSYNLEDKLLTNLVFYASNVPPLGVKVFRVTFDYPAPQIVFENKKSSVTLDNLGGINGIRIGEKFLNVTQKLIYYTSSSPNEHIFQPLQGAKIFSRISKHTILTGPIFDEVVQTYSNIAVQVIRVYKNESYLEFEWSIKANAMNSRRVMFVSRFETEINSNSYFFTDSNGRGNIRRVRNFRKGFFYKAEESTSGNYYPVGARAFIQDPESDVRFSVLLDRPSGCTSLFNGQIEIMLHRNTLVDGATGKYFVTFGTIKDNYDIDLMFERLNRPQVFIADISTKFASLESLQETVSSEFIGFKKKLPEQINLLTLEPWIVDVDCILLRLEYARENGEAVKVDLKEAFELFEILWLSETTLGANKPIENSKQLSWNGEETTSRHYDYKLEVLKIYMKPMEIRTFIAHVRYFYTF